MSTEYPEITLSGTPNTSARIVGPQDGAFMGDPGVLHDRFMVTKGESGGGFALVEHLLPGHVLAAPLHRHSREDEYSYVLSGRVGAKLGEEVVFGETGDLIFKPRGQWHTFWSASDEPARILEIISPGGFEECFREMNGYGESITPEIITEIGKRFGVEVDFEGTMPLIEQHGLTFWA
jgi:quercetin dioxygenase-like cupin family protein